MAELYHSATDKLVNHRLVHVESGETNTRLRYLKITLIETIKKHSIGPMRT